MTESEQLPHKQHRERSHKATRQDRAILALLQHPTIEKAAAAADIHPATLYRWMKEPTFIEKRLAAQKAAFSQCSARLQQAAPAAANRLLHLVANQGTPPAVVIRACESILKFGESSYQREVLEARLSKLEAQHADTASQKKSQAAPQP